MRARFPLYLKITASSFLVVMVVLAFLSVIAYRDQYHSVEEKFGLTLQHVAQTSALFLDGDAQEAVRSNADTGGAAFQRLRDTLEKVRKENDLNEDQLYTLRPIPGGELEFVIMLQRKPFVGDRFMPAPAAMKVAQAVLADGHARHTPIYTDKYGSFVSGFAPIRDRTGKGVGLLEVDYGVDRFLAELTREGMKRMWTVPAALLLALLLSIFVAYTITKAVARLVEGTAAVNRGEYDQRVEVRTRDELRTLADAFNIMLGGLRERFAMLKFVPKHTRAMIALAASSSDPKALGALAEKRDVAVFFSDIRGFTALSDRLEPSRVIEMLNIYLRKEAEIIERHGGSVDKFIGDAVMAIFEGPDRFPQAARAAVEIQHAMTALNDQHAFDQSIDVGIGIAGGEVVMGSLGYEDRLEFAVIGRLVNLASRLTSVAGRGEIVVSELARSQILQGYRFEALENLKLKGFAEAVTCYKLADSAAG